ncbi:MAG: nicotinate (nicotinamide) nucleotide adenylyltransferase [Deltaproteobacteria bacterium]|nr:nicotinate (nicotinamide) nucleotide adenylyltransferase [Deltaproteobacteria bacterium]MBW2175682.1 nicotinate (nicotinamide) nucleotide adenylyltransferase [Deltaproteobacteria bacterium]MBW2297998.1 nicotinate (nicotinamide) nucleotide adenylyltransferase [Deltaproteobacteria bacterium]MBW2635461.1 nicotinate (nicotinamide) nucleotide adenylyltransferase [Deltaproteobacteria bacterium]MBW2676334.1 nicotinate (nicotinamide) nucleotide adenylyltransferase [Deltaproteobacteria bacterium]
MKIGLFGGTFNPIHLGHLRAIKEVSETFELSKTYLIPAALPPHKPHQDIAAAKDRLAMIRLAVDHLAAFEISDIELNRSGPSYTIDTLKHFKSVIGPAHQTYLIMGIDAFLEIDTWKSYLEIFKLTPVIIMARPAGTDSRSDSPWKSVADFIRQKVSLHYDCTDTHACHSSDEYQSIYFTDVSLLDISGTKIRDLVRQGKSIRFLVPEQIEHYIRQRGLYR